MLANSWQRLGHIQRIFGQVPATTLLGDDNTVVNSTLSMTNNGGLKVSGDRNRVENILVEYTDWLGTL